MDRVEIKKYRLKNLELRQQKPPQKYQDTNNKKRMMIIEVIKIHLITLSYSYIKLKIFCFY